MVDERWRCASWIAVLALGGCAANDTPLVLDLICRGSADSYNTDDGCRVSGDAQATTGITGDSYAVHLGSSTGALHIKLAAIASTIQASWSLDALAASTAPEGSTLYRSLTWGSCGGACPGDPSDVQAALKDEFQWAKVVETVPGTDAAYPPLDAELTLRGADIDIVDVRLPGYSQYYYY